MSLQNMPFVPARWFDNSGNALAGGFLWFYLRGTSTPATGALWKNPDRTAAWANPVQLDGSGHADIFLDPGAYTVVLKDYSSAQVLPPVDIVQGGSGFGAGEGGTARMVANYAAVRALATAYDALYVLGRTAEGDGGEGWFQRIPGSTETDDDGAILVAGINRYKRVGMISLSPRWYGVAYGTTTAQDSAFAKALASAGTDKLGLPVLVDGSIYLGVDTTVASGVTVRFTEAGRLVSGVGGVVLTFAPGAKVDGTLLQTFGASVQPKFPAGLQSARLSWMGGATGDDRLNRLANCCATGESIAAILDDSVWISTNVTFGAGITLDVQGGKINITAHANLSVSAVSYTGLRQWISYANSSAVGTLTLGTGPVPPEWFGAVGDGVADDTVSVLAAITTGWAILRKKHLVTAALAVVAGVRIDGPLIDTVYLNENFPLGAPSDPTPNLSFSAGGSIAAPQVLDARGVCVQVSAGHAAGAFKGASFSMFRECYFKVDQDVDITGNATAAAFYGCVLPVGIYPVAKTVINECRFTAGSSYTGMVQHIAPRLVDAILSGITKLDSLKNLQDLGTAADGTIQAGSSTRSFANITVSALASLLDLAFSGKLTVGIKYIDSGTSYNVQASDPAFIKAVSSVTTFNLPTMSSGDDRRFFWLSNGGVWKAWVYRHGTGWVQIGGNQ